MMFMRLTLKLILPAMAMFFGLTLTSRALGETQPLHPALRGFSEECEDKPQPCWYGIMPGVTTAGEAIARLEAQAYRLSRPQRLADGIFSTELFHNPDEYADCNISIGGRNGRNRWTHLSAPLNVLSIDCQYLTLGEAINYFGFPDQVEFCGILLLYKPGIAIHNFGTPIRLSPYSHTLQLNIYQREQDETAIRNRSWHGFAPCWRYNQFKQ